MRIIPLMLIYVIIIVAAGVERVGNIYFYFSFSFDVLLKHPASRKERICRQFKTVFSSININRGHFHSSWRNWSHREDFYLMDDDIQICSDDRSIGRSIVKHLGREKVVENISSARPSTKREGYKGEKERDR
jgi:hypothetical protein